MFFSMLLPQVARADKPHSRPSRLSIERLESRELLAAAGLIEVGTQPSGALDDKIVYLHGGHGITWNGSGWGYQRPLLLDMVEDLGNQDQMTILADYLWNAGATVVPLRPIGNQVNEVVLDNDDAGVTFSAGWTVSSGSVFFGGAGDLEPYQFATTSTVETATAEYRPDLPEDGFYPVYTWVTAGTNRATDQLYRVHHTGGATEVTIDHSRVGNGVVYLGTYHFEAGTDGYVEISNQSSEAGKVVIADMIRFGNGMGDVAPGGVVSGQPRENEAGLYWIQWHAENARGVSSSEYGTSTVSAPPLYAEYMNQAGVGTLSDRVFVSYHSNATTGDPATATSRGVLALLNGNNRDSAETPNQLLLAETLGRQVNDDLVAQNGSFEHDWYNRTTVTLDRSDIEFGEINNESINNEFDATILETGFHDNTEDAEMLRDPRVRAAIAQATTQGLVDYFDALDTTTPNVDAPPPVTGVRVETDETGSATVTWTPGVASSFAGGAADGYVVYASTDGYGFDGGRSVAGAGTTSLTIDGLDPNETYYFRVAAANTGGESVGSEVVAARPVGADASVLIVNGFDRLDRFGVATEPFVTGDPVDRVRPRLQNSFDYAVQHAEAIEAFDAAANVSTASNEMVASGAVSLDDYDAVFWILGEESSADSTFDPTEQTAVSNYLGQGGKLFLSGAEIGWDLDWLNNGRSFYNNALRADYVSDDAAVYTASGVTGSIFEGLDVEFDDGSRVYNVEYPDVIAPLGGATVALDYAGSAAGAAIQYDGGGDQLVMLGFPFETITDEATRAELMGGVLEFFAFTPAARGDYNRDGAIDGADYDLWRSTYGLTVEPGGGADGNGNGRVDSADYSVWREAEAIAAATAGEAASVTTEANVAPAPAPAAEAANDDAFIGPKPRQSGAATGADDAASIQRSRLLLWGRPASDETADRDRGDEAEAGDEPHGRSTAEGDPERIAPRWVDWWLNRRR